MRKMRPKFSASATAELLDLAREVYGDSVDAFWTTPRRSLANRTPREALDAGDGGKVRDLLIKALDGTFA